MGAGRRLSWLALLHMHAGDLDGAHAYVDKVVAEKKLEGEIKQQAMSIKIILYANQQKFDEALKTLDAVKAVAPDSELAGQLGQFRGRLEAAKLESEKAAKITPTWVIPTSNFLVM